MAVFFRPCHCASYGAAVVGRLRPAGFLEYRSANPVICRSSPFSSGPSGLQPLLKEAHMPSSSSHLHIYLNRVRRLTLARRRAAIAGEAV